MGDILVLVICCALPKLIEKQPGPAPLPNKMLMFALNHQEVSSLAGPKVAAVEILYKMLPNYAFVLIDRLLMRDGAEPVPLWHGLCIAKGCYC